LKNYLVHGERNSVYLVGLVIRII